MLRRAQRSPWRPAFIVITALLASALHGLGVAVPSSAAALTGLTFTDTDIPVVEVGTRLFKMTVPSGSTSTKMTLAYGSGTATYSVDGGSSTSLASGVASAPIAINDGLTSILIRHSDGGVDTEYTAYLLKVRPLTGIEVENATLSPAFDPAVFSYTVRVPYGSTTARVRASWDTTTTANATGFEYCVDTGATGVTQTPGEWATLTDLGVGDNYRNLLLLTNTPQGWVGGCTSGFPQRYELKVVRDSAFTSSTLSALTLTDTDVSIVSDATPYSFSGTAQSGSASTKVTATFSTGTASYSVGGGSAVSLSSGVASSAIALNDGLTTITVTHVGATTTTYTVHVRKVRPLTGIVVEGGTISPAFDPGVFGYTVTLPNSTERTRIKATWDTTTTANATGFDYCIDTGFPSVSQTPGEWSGYGDLGVGDNYRNLLLLTNTPQGWVGGCTSGFPQRYEIRIVRASAFAGIDGVTTNAPPVGTQVPAGTSITATPLNVTGVPAPTITYEWEAAPAPSNEQFTVVATTSTPSWTPDNSVAGQFIRVSATASNGVSTETEARSLVFGPIQGVPEAPAIQSVTIAGTPRVGDPMTASVSVTGFPAPALTYEWASSATAGGTFTAVAGGSGASYTPTASDVGRTFKVTVTASNTSGADATRVSDASDAVLDAPSSAGSEGQSTSGSAGARGLARPGVQAIDALRPPSGYLPGSAAAAEDGGAVAISSSREPATGAWRFEGPQFSVVLRTRGGLVDPAVSPSSMLAVAQGGAVEISARGFLSGTQLTAYLVPDPDPSRGNGPGSRETLPVGSADVLADGTVLLRGDVPLQAGYGPYVLQVNGYATDSRLRSLNVGIDVVQGMPVLRSGVSTRAAFFRPRSAALSAPGARKIAALASNVPAGSRDVRVAVTAVSIGERTLTANRALATARARTLLARLRDAGLEGAATVILVTERSAATGVKAAVSRGESGRPLTTVSVSYAVP